MAELDWFVQDACFRENICCYAVIEFCHCRVINPRLLAKVPFEPRTAIIFLFPYLASDPKNISRYASGGDYHYYASEFFRMNMPVLRLHSGGHQFVGFCDHSPIDERHAAATAGLGMIGDNGMLIHPQYGSFVFVAEWLTDTPPECFTTVEPQPIKGCDHCGACARACPAANLPEFSRRKCISAITQKKGELTEQEIELLKKGGSVWGCDICQNVCPYNVQLLQERKGTPIRFFGRHQIHCMTTDELSRMSDEEFSLRAYSYRKREVLERNLKLLGY